MKKWEQNGLSGNSGNASGNTKMPMGRAFIIDVPTVPTKNHISFMRARHTHAYPVMCVYVARIRNVFRSESGNSGNNDRKPACRAVFDVPTFVPTVPTVPTPEVIA